MNHSALIKAAHWPVDFANKMRNEGRFFVLGECNSIYGQGAVSVSDVFGAALWNVDFALYMAANVSCPTPLRSKSDCRKYCPH